MVKLFIGEVKVLVRNLDDEKGESKKVKGVTENFVETILVEGLKEGLLFKEKAMIVSEV